MNDIILTFLVMFFWALWAFFGKIATQKIHMQTVFWTYLIGSILIIGYLVVTKKIIPLSLDRYGILFAILSGIAIGLGSIIYWHLVDKKPVGILLITISLYPFFVILLSSYFLKESFSINKLIGVFFALLALVFLNLK